MIGKFKVKMKRPLIKASICVLVFIVSVLIISAITNKGNTDMTVEMKAATYPLIYMELNGERINCLHGYASKMQDSYMRDNITPISEDRVVTFSIDKFKRKIRSLSFEVRSVDGSRLIESTSISADSDDHDTIRASVTLKDLIEQNQEYCFILLLDMDDGEVLRYYTRVIQPVDYHVEEKIAFVKEFHTKTFTKDESISRYLESNAEGDNTSYHLVTIHSNFKQITWGDMNLKKKGEPIITIKELGTQTASIRLDYLVSDENHTYRISEFYRVRYGRDRMYLLDFERDMNQFFGSEEDVFINNKIVLGISDQNIDMQESDDGNILAFNHENSLYSYNATDNRYICLFSFYDENYDLRDVYNQHDMKILSVEESGNIRFMVYGYMNRGRHEGQVGIQVYYYNSVLNTIEEDAFIQYDKSYELLSEEIGQLSYVSKNNMFYFILDATIYSVDLTNKMSSVVAENLAEDTFKVSKNNQMIVWQTDQDKYNNDKLILMNLNTKKKTTIKVSEDKRITPLGFMNSDLIYGIANKEDIVKEKSGVIIFPMNEVIIQNESEEILKDYKKDNVYVVEGEIEYNQLNMTRVKKVEKNENEKQEKSDVTVSENDVDMNIGAFHSSQYEEISDDQIMNNVIEEVGKNAVVTVMTEKYEKIVQIALERNINNSTIKFRTPKEVLFEGGREVFLTKTKEKAERYYVYGKNGIESICTKPATAINLASDLSGVVLNDKGEYVWKKGNLLIKNQIMKIQPAKVEDQNSIAVCLDTMLAYENVMRNSNNLLMNGETVYSILNDNLEDAQILILSGCSLESILYYVNRDIPVMAMLDDGSAVLIVGFNELNTVIMDPQTGTIYKKGMNDSKEWFEKNGNSFITYIK